MAEVFFAFWRVTHCWQRPRTKPSLKVSNCDSSFTLLQEVHNREPCDSGFTLVCLGIGKKNPREQSVGERSTAGESPSQGRYYTPKLELLDFFVNKKGQQTLLSPDGNY